MNPCGVYDDGGRGCLFCEETEQGVFGCAADGSDNGGYAVPSALAFEAVKPRTSLPPSSILSNGKKLKIA